MNLRAAHDHRFKNRIEILASTTCGCFHCERIFSPTEVREWVDESDEGIGQTAVCPHCGVDALLGSASGLSLTPGFLAEMRAYWFE